MEHFQLMTDPDIPTCCGTKMSKIFGRVGVHFKGSGFYETDYKKKEKKQDKFIGIEA